MFKVGYGLKKDKFTNFMEKRRNRKGQFSVVEFGENRGAYNITNKDYPEFLDLYSKQLGKRELNFIEWPKKVGPLMVDIDWTFKTPKRQYKLKHIKGIIKAINDSVKKYFKVKPKNLTAFVTEKPKPSVKSETKFKDGMHIIYPFLALSIPSRFLMLDELKDLIDKRKVFSDLKFTNSIHDVVDLLIVENVGFVMFGSRKKDGPVYKLTHVIHSDLKEEDLRNYPQRTLPKLLSNRKFKPYEKTSLSPDIDFQLFKKKLSNMYRKYHTVRTKMLGRKLKFMKLKDIRKLLKSRKKSKKNKENKLRRSRSKKKRDFLKFEIENLNTSIGEILNELELREDYYND